MTDCPTSQVADQHKIATEYPCVDVVIAAKDRADTIERAVMSALAQAEVRTVIVIDDGSADETAAVASRCNSNDKRILVKRLQSSVGPAAARNIGIEMSTSPWVAILDGDDFFLPDRICRLLANSADCDFVADDLLQIGEERIGKLGSSLRITENPAASKPLALEEFILGNVTRRDAYRRELGFLKPLIRLSFLSNNAIRYAEELRLGEDYALYAQALAARARFVLLPFKGYVAVVREGSLSGRHSQSDLERLRDWDCKLMATKGLSTCERRAIANHYLSVDCRVQWLAMIAAYKEGKIVEFFKPFFRSRTVAAYLLQKTASEGRSRLKLAARDYFNSLVPRRRQ
jgi:succinoglycan biosynthesis protein ExoU